MGIVQTREALSRIFYQRCFWLFTVLIVLIGAVSFVPATDQGRLVLNAVNMFLLIATVAAVGRTTHWARRCPSKSGRRSRRYRRPAPAIASGS